MAKPFRINLYKKSCPKWALEHFNFESTSALSPIYCQVDYCQQFAGKQNSFLPS